MNDHSDKSFGCSMDTGECGPMEHQGITKVPIDDQFKVRMLYFTDPICSACWAIEPHLKRFKLEYGDYIEVEYRMGGLLPKWNGFRDKANGISDPSDVAVHWDEVGQRSGMSIDGDIWLEDPLDSSFPPSVAFKAVQRQGNPLALKFLRSIREKLFLEKKNITREHHLIDALRQCGGDVTTFRRDYRDGTAMESFEKDLQDGRDFGIRGFPTFIFLGRDGLGYKISGMAGYERYATTLEKAYGKIIAPKPIPFSEYDLLQKYGYLATQEIAFVLSQDQERTRVNLLKLMDSGRIRKEKHKFGDFWRIHAGFGQG